jgi:CubicO group peptidase (beta-lactamase class C family)
MWLLCLPVGAQDLDRKFQDWCARLKPEQASLILVRDQKLEYSHYGGATSSTPYLLASLSKGFTALCVRRLVDAGRLQLDEPVRELLPGFGLSEQITLRQLLCHRSGLSKAGGNRFFSGDRETILKYLQTTNPGPPGMAFEYSNSNYVLLGLIIEAVSGHGYAEELQATVLRPLGMNLTQVGMLNGRAAVTQPSWPAGGIVSAPEDMALYLRYQLEHPELQKPLTAGDEYAWGWFADASGSWANHSGDIFNGRLNYQCYILLRPKAHRGLVILGKFPPGTSPPNWREVDRWLP